MTHEGQALVESLSIMRNMQGGARPVFPPAEGCLQSACTYQLQPADPRQSDISEASARQTSDHVPPDCIPAGPGPSLVMTPSLRPSGWSASFERTHALQGSRRAFRFCPWLAMWPSRCTTLRSSCACFACSKSLQLQVQTHNCTHECLSALQLWLPV